MKNAHTITLNQKKYYVYIIKKKVKRVMIKVNQVNDIYINCPMSCSSEAAIKYLEEQMDWLKKIIAKHEMILEKFPIKKFIDNKVTFIYGKVFNIVVDETIKRDSKITDDTLYVKKDVKKTLNKLVISLSNFIEEEFNYVNKAFSSHIKQKAYLEIKNLRSRWGSCNYKTGRIVINRYLVHAPKHLLNYVLMHEFVHFLYPNHSRNFYKFLEECLPNYKSLEAELKMYSFLLMK